MQVKVAPCRSSCGEGRGKKEGGGGGGQVRIRTKEGKSRRRTFSSVREVKGWGEGGCIPGVVAGL